jgi:hypothetical protein
MSDEHDDHIQEGQKSWQQNSSVSSLVGHSGRNRQRTSVSPKKTALAVFSSDALSSTAYATEEILLVLAVAYAYGQNYAFQYVVPISVGIAVLLAIVAASYRQTIHAYPSGGGAYIVAKENLGTTIISFHDRLRHLSLLDARRCCARP